jgi:hypothetical protein
MGFYEAYNMELSELLPSSILLVMKAEQHGKTESNTHT